MNVKKIYFAFFIFMLSFSFVLGACTQKDNRTIVFEADYEALEPSTYFGTYGSIRKADKNGAIILIKSASTDVGPLTYFGTETRNVTWVDRGLAVELTMDIKLEDYKTNDAFNWTITLNNDENQILTNLSVCFRKYENGLRVGHSTKSSEESNINATKTENEESQLISEDGKYVLEVSFYSNKEDLILYNIIVKNEKNEKVLNIKSQNLTDANDSNIKTEYVGGLRSAWLSYMTAQSVTLDKIRIVEN